MKRICSYLVVGVSFVCVAAAQLPDARVVGALKVLDRVRAVLDVGQERDQSRGVQTLLDQGVDLDQHRGRDQQGLVGGLDQRPADGVMLVGAV